jgi:hypothetical protein
MREQIGGDSDMTSENVRGPFHILRITPVDPGKREQTTPPSDGMSGTRFKTSWVGRKHELGKREQPSVEACWMRPDRVRVICASSRRTE